MNDQFQADSRVNHFFEFQHSCDQSGSKSADRTQLCYRQLYSVLLPNLPKHQQAAIHIRDTKHSIIGYQL